MFLRIGLLCSALSAAAIVAGDNPEFKPLSCLTSSKSLAIIKKLRGFHKNFADQCDDNSSRKDQEKCKTLVTKLYTNNITNKDDEKVSAWQFANALIADLDLKQRSCDSCAAQYKDPVDLEDCRVQGETAISNASSSLMTAIDKKEFTNEQTNN